MWFSCNTEISHLHMSRVTVVILVLVLFIGSLKAQDDPREFFKFAKFKYDKEEYKSSLDFLNSAIDKDIKYVSAYYLRAKVYYELNKYQSSILDINTIFKIEPIQTTYAGNYYLTRGKSYLAINDLKSATLDFDKSMEFDDSNSELFFYKAKLEHSKRNYKYALRDIDKAIRLKTDDAAYYALRSKVKIEYLKPVKGSNDYKSILGDINVAIALEPDCYQHYMIRSEFYNSMDQFDEAITDYNKVIEISPLEETAYIERGVIKMNNYEYKSAANDFTTSIKINPNNELNYRYRGLCNNNMSNYNEAYNDFTKSIDLLKTQLSESEEKELVKSTLAETYLLRGHCLNLMGNNAQACRDFLQATNLGIKKALNYYRKYCGIY